MTEPNRNRPAGNEAASKSFDGDASRISRIGCPCGHGPGEPCVTTTPTPTGSQFCPCSRLEVHQLAKPAAWRWHLAGHPDVMGGAA